MSCLLITASNSQHLELSFRNLDYKDGLPQSEFPEEMIEDHLGRIWIGYTNGLYCYDGVNIKHFSARISDSTALSENRIQCLYVDNDHRVWIGTRNTGISIYNPETDRFSRMMPVDQGGTFPIPRIWDIVEDRDSLIWIAGKPGLILYDPSSGISTHFLFKDSSISAMALEWTNTFRSLVQDPLDPDLLWIGTRAGLLSFSKSSQNFLRHPMPYIKPGTTTLNMDYMVMEMKFSTPDNLWCATWAGGLMRYNTLSGKWTNHLELQNPAEEHSVYEIGVKDRNTLWLASRQLFGIYHIPSNSYDFYKNDQDDPSSLAYGFAVGDFLFTQDSALLIAGTQALSIASYPGYHPNLNRTRPMISEIHINDNPRSFDVSNQYLDHFSLREDENTIRFTMGWPVFANWEDWKWRYKLIGKDRDWVESKSNSVVYSGLDGGRYTFHYQASLDGEFWSSGLNSPDFHIHIPFWKKPLFIVFNVLALGSVLYLFYRMHIGRIKEELIIKSQYDQRINELEMAALRAQMNPHFLFNALNSIKSYILKEDKRSASRYLTKFSRLMRIILNNSKQKFITLAEELDALHLFIEFEEMRFSKNFQYRITVDDGVDKEEIYLPPLMIQPFVENAIWHGLLHKEDQGILNIKIYQEAQSLKILIEDNGVGRVKSQQLKSKSGTKKKSFGLQITDDRIKLIKNKFGMDANLEIIDLYDDNNTAVGTKVILTIPLLTRMDIQK